MATETEEQTQHDSILGLSGEDRLRAGQQFVTTAPNRTITKLAFKLRKHGSPPGDVTFTIRSIATGNILNSKVWGAAIDLPTAYPAITWQEVTFDTPVFIDEYVRMLVEYSEGDDSNRVQVSIHTAYDIKPNEDLVGYDGSWRTYGGNDCTYRYIYITTVIPTITTDPATAMR